MAVITRINGVPLFSSIQEALRWGRFNRLKGGYHVHYWEGQKGYMGGNNHSELAKRRPMKIDPTLAAKYKANKISPPKAPVRPVRPVRPARPVRPTTDRTTSSDGGY